MIEYAICLQCGDVHEESKRLRIAEHGDCKTLYAYRCPKCKHGQYYLDQADTKREVRERYKHLFQENKHGDMEQRTKRADE